MLETEFHDSADTFLNLLFQDLDRNKIALEKNWDIDHICYRTSSDQEYENLKNIFTNFSVLLIESDVNGRLISTFRLNRPINYKSWRIDLVELPAPKKGKITSSGFEHIEVVCDVPFDNLISKYNHLHLETKGLAKSFNQELEICLGERNIKFHQLSLESVINIEKNDVIWKSLKRTNVLQMFKQYSPLIAGTFPLGINTSSSDLDILMTAQDLKEAENNLRHAFKGIIEITSVDEEETLICRFKDQEVLYEIFVQKIPSVLQTGYRHFLVEEKLLKFRGHVFLAEICKLKNSGLKTEPAFAKLLQIPSSEDPYKALLRLQEMPLSRLIPD